MGSIPRACPRRYIEGCRTSMCVFALQRVSFGAMADDQQLLRDFAERHSQDAFTLLVQRHVNLVYSAALRQLGGDSHLAWDASQSVFLALAQNASRLVNHRALTGWLYTTTHYVSAKIVRTRQRSSAREEAVSAMENIFNE